MEFLPVAVGWAASNLCRFSALADSSFGQGFCSGTSMDIEELAKSLSPDTQILFPKDQGFKKASQRWNQLGQPNPSVVVIPSVANDVATTVKYANKHNVPFLAVGGHHGASSTLGKMKSGIEIVMRNLDRVERSADGKTATVGGGALSKTVIDALWKADKQTVTGTCECTGHLGPGLGGGHGWLQGQHGLIADQFISVDAVLADGTEITVDEKSDPELWWALRGAGHNFAIINSVKLKVYDITHRNWARETMVFTGDSIEDVYQTMNRDIFKDGKQDANLVVWSYFLNIPDIDSSRPVLIVFMMQEGADVVDEAYSAALKKVGPVSVDDTPGTYLDLAAWTMIAIDSMPCQKLDGNNLRFPLYLKKYNVPAMRKAYDMFAAALKETPEFTNSIFLFESYPVQAVQSVPSEGSAFAFRGDNILLAPLISYASGDSALDKKAVEVGKSLRAVLHGASGRKTMHTYVNYAFRDAKEEMYGDEDWRQEKLARLKKKYDPKSRFDFYNPVA